MSRLNPEDHPLSQIMAMSQNALEPQRRRNFMWPGYTTIMDAKYMKRKFFASENEGCGRAMDKKSAAKKSRWKYQTRLDQSIKILIEQYDVDG
jgi:hypothetical protein